MRVLVVGSGAREHALCWAIAASPLVTGLSCAPGNDGIAGVADLVDLADDDVDALTAWARDNAVDLVVPGPEAPLVLGLADALDDAGIPCFGPVSAAARLEGSKVFMKEVADAAGIPTAAWRRFTDPASARAWVAERGAPVVVKADGLAAGKGVTVAATLEDANEAIEAALVDRVFGSAGNTVVVEEFLDGEEASFHALVDGANVLPLATAQDHKRAGEDDTGPNTGGMGAYSPAPVVTEAMEQRVLATIVRPAVAEMARRGAAFRGVLYAGLMITPAGPKLLEFNVRFGDPECQALMTRLRSDIVPALIAACDGELDHVDLRWKPEASLTVVMAAQGYPGSYPKGTPIAGIESARDTDVEVFHAGTRRDGERWLSTGGRVLGVTALGVTVADARARAYKAVERIDWPCGFYRRDIGSRAVRNGN